MKLLSTYFDPILTNSAATLAAAFGTAAAILLIIAFALALARRRFRRAAETPGEFDDFVLAFVRSTNLVLLALPSIAIGTRLLTMPQETEAIVGTLARLSLIGQAALWAGTVIDFSLRRYHRRRTETDPAAITTIRAFRFATVLVVWCIAVLMALDSLGLNVTTLVTGLGIGGVAIALATQNILGDLFASLSIVLDKPFVVGDFIAAGGDLGQVEQIGLKTTRVRSLSGEQLVFSNSDLLKSRVRNYKRMDERRIVFRLGVVYQTSLDQLRRIPLIVRAIIERQKPVHFDRGHFASFGDSSYDFEFVYYVVSPDYNVYMDVQQEINLAIVEAFEAEKIDFAYPTRTLLLGTSMPEISPATSAS